MMRFAPASTRPVSCGEAAQRDSNVQSRGWDAQVRKVAARHGVVYQGCSLLTANRRETDTPTVHAIAKAHGKTMPQVVFRFALQLGMLPLTGTTNSEHMAQDLDIFDFALSDDEMARIGESAGMVET